MNVITFVSRDGGTGKSTLAVHLAVAAVSSGCRCLLVDAGRKNALTTWHAKRPHDAPVVRNAGRGIKQALAAARLEGFEWIIIDAPSDQWQIMNEAIRAATLAVIPARASCFDLAAVRETVSAIREQNKPYAVVINASPARRDGRELFAVAAARAQLEKLQMPVWAGQITQRTGFAIALATGTSVLEMASAAPAAEEIGGLWSAIARSVAAVKRASYRAATSQDHDLPAEAA